MTLTKAAIRPMSRSKGRLRIRGLFRGAFRRMGPEVVRSLSLSKASVPMSDLYVFPYDDAFLVLQPDLSSLLASTWAGGYRDTAGISIPFGKAEEYGRDRAGTLITDVAGTTHDRVEEVVRGLLGDTFENADVSETEIADALLEEFDSMADWRASLIADTETAFAANYGNLSGYRDTGVEYVLVSDGTDSDEECADADGQTWTVDEAEANALEHPNCGRSFDSIDTADVAPEDLEEAVDETGQGTPIDETVVDPVESLLPDRTGYEDVLPTEGTTLADAAQRWGYDSTDIKNSIYAGTPDADGTMLLQAMAEAPDTAPSVWRGLSVDESLAERLSTVGNTYETPIASFTEVKGVAEEYVQMGEGEQGLLMQLLEGSRALSVGEAGYFSEDLEWLAGGRFEIVSVDRSHAVWRVAVRQVASVKP